MRRAGLNDETLFKCSGFECQKEVMWRDGWRALHGKGCLMESVLCYLIICCPAAGNKHAEMFRAKKG